MHFNMHPVSAFPATRHSVKHSGRAGWECIFWLFRSAVVASSWRKT